MPEEVDRLVQKEITVGRIVGPLSEPPFNRFQCSPIGLVEKQTPGQYRLIHHLSSPAGQSVNEQIEPEWATVSYAGVQDAISLVQSFPGNAVMAKTDVEKAFRLLPLHPEVQHLFVFHWKGSFYVDRAMQMGCSSSCHLFEAFSTAIEWIATQKLRFHSYTI
jgi:hypothetical protein